jgi:pilus assembly protein CpaE
MAPHSSGLKVLLAPSRPEMAEEVTGAQVKIVLEALRRDFSYVVVDTPSALNDHTLAVFDMSDRIILLTTPDIPALYNTRMAFEILQALEFPADKTFFVVNRIDKRGGIRAADIEESLKHTVAAQIPLDERSVLLSINQGVPLVMGDRSKPSAQGIIELAQKIKAQLEVSEADVVPLPAKEKEKEDKRLTGRIKRFGG